jgi:HEAT repeat protein
MLTGTTACGGPPAPVLEAPVGAASDREIRAWETLPPGNPSPPYIPVSTEVLVNLSHPDKSVRLEAVDALPAADPRDAIGHLTLALHDPDDTVREAAIEALAEIGGEDAALALTAAMDDPDSDLREDVVHALGEIGGETARAMLQQALSDPDHRVVKSATHLLRER